MKPSQRIRPLCAVLAACTAMLFCAGPGHTQAEAIDAQKSFASGASGAASGTTGADPKDVVAVTSLADKGTGSLRDALSQPGRYVVFAVDGEIHLRGVVTVPSETTVDGRGSKVVVRGKGLEITGSNVVVRNISIAGDPAVSDSNDDAITVTDAATGVWVDHVDLSSFKDGLFDVTRGATKVTLSWSRLHDHGKAALIGSATREGSPPLVSITLHHNLFDKTGERNPLARHGDFHIYNNEIRSWGYDQKSGYAVGLGCGARVLLEANVFQPSFNHRGVEVHESKACDPGRLPALRTSGNDFGGAEVVADIDAASVPAPAGSGSVDRANAALTAALDRFTGSLDVPRSVPLPAGVTPASTPDVTGKQQDQNDGGRSNAPLILGLVVVGAVGLAVGLAIGRRRSVRS